MFTLHRDKNRRNISKLVCAIVQVAFLSHTYNRAENLWWAALVWSKDF